MKKSFANGRMRNFSRFTKIGPADAAGTSSPDAETPDSTFAGTPGLTDSRGAADADCSELFAVSLTAADSSTLVPVAQRRKPFAAPLRACTKKGFRHACYARKNEAFFRKF